MSSGWGNDPDASSSTPGQPSGGQLGQQPGQPAQPGEPGYPGPSQPGYPGPSQPGYPPPGQPGYPGPSQPGYPPPGQPGYAGPAQPASPGAPPERGRRGLIGGVILAVIVIVIVAAFFLFRDRLSNDVTSLAVGECFDEPATTTEAVTDVQRQPCNEAHDGEVIASLTHPAGANEPYPVVSGFDDYILENCIPVFETYTGRDWDTATDLVLSYFRPTPDGWREGDRGFTCYVARADGQKMTNTIRGAGST